MSDPAKSQRFGGMKCATAPAGLDTPYLQRLLPEHDRTGLSATRLGDGFALLETAHDHFETLDGCEKDPERRPIRMA